MKLWVKIVIAMGLGLLVGSLTGEGAAVYFKPLGTLFLNLIHMIIVLLVLSSMTVGITSIHDPKKLGRVGLKTLGLYLLNTLIAIFLGLSLAYLFGVGEGLNLVAETSYVEVSSPNFSEILLSIVPTNPIASLVSGNVLQIIVFSIFLGIAINMAGEKGRPLAELMESLADVMYQVTSIVMEFSPIGVFGIMAWIAGSFGLGVLLKLVNFLVVYYFACAILVFGFFVGLLRFVAKLPPLPFFRGMRDAMIVAFSTCSSSAALPVAMQCVQQNLGVSKNVASFVLPLGSTVNMGGAAIFQAMSAIFISKAYGINLDFQSLLTITVTAVLSAIGAAGIPGTGFLMLSAVLSSVGLPIEGIGLLAGIDRVREMVSAMVNSMGDAIVAVVVAKQEGELDELQYNDAQVFDFEPSES